MPILVEMPADLEDQVHRAAAAEGVDASTFLREAAAARLRPLPPPQSMSETELLMKITEGFPTAFWERYHALVARRDAETLTPEEQTELIGFSDRTEARAVERLIYLTELSARRGRSVQDLMTELGIRPTRVDATHDF